MDSNKTGGATGTTREHILHAPSYLHDWLLELTTPMFGGSIPPALRHGVINPLVKDHNRFRAINLLETTYKLGDPQASTLFLFCQHLTLMLVEKYGGPGFPLPPTPLPPGCEGPLPPPLPVKVLSYADDTKPIDTTLKGVLQSISHHHTPGTEIPSPPPSILALDAYGTFAPQFPTILPHIKDFRFLGHRLQQSPAPDPLNPNLYLPGSHHSEIYAMHLATKRSFEFVATSRNSSTKQLREAARANLIPRITGIQQHAPPLPTIIEEIDESLTKLALNSIDLSIHESSLKPLSRAVCSPADQGGLGLPSLRASIIHRQSNLIQAALRSKHPWLSFMRHKNQTHLRSSLQGQPSNGVPTASEPYSRFSPKPIAHSPALAVP
ncbi:hypothetical protein T484DRAFT_1987814 [Baffinella frigidus]|nr:hypothetical protein T484DRAFT_1987814 [Cryptophyta sp. CCMP2293]